LIAATNEKATRKASSVKQRRRLAAKNRN